MALCRACKRMVYCIGMDQAKEDRTECNLRYRDIIVAGALLDFFHRHSRDTIVC
jgi:hypothetical protein